jgi:hypothetical protein
MERTYRTKQEMIEYFKECADDFRIQGSRSNNDFFLGKAAAYEMAAFELEHNMEG